MVSLDVLDRPSSSDALLLAMRDVEKPSELPVSKVLLRVLLSTIEVDVPGRVSSLLATRDVEVPGLVSSDALLLPT